MIWNSTDVLNALLGGLLIGLAASLFILFNGRIAGISGVLAGVMGPQAKQWWRWAFIIGLLASPFMYIQFAPLPEVTIQANTLLTIVAGLLVGIGTRLGNGCTSGHGVCGIARFSKRSIIATTTFMLTGFVTVYVMRHWLG